MKSLRNLPAMTRREAWVEVNLGALEQNIERLRQALPSPLEMMAVLKADAYGHGAIMVVPTLTACGVSIVGVAAMDEALQLRQAGLDIPILVLGVVPDWAMPSAVEQDIQITVFSQAHIDSLARLYHVTGERITVQIKVDTGMNRIGMDWEQATAFIMMCQAQPFLDVQGVFSHLASALDPVMTQKQISRWESVISALPIKPHWLHLLNTDGALHYTVNSQNLVRLGIGLFGYQGQERPSNLTLLPVMGLKARIVHLHHLPPGEGISYGQTYINNTSIPRLIATLPLGYADGIPRGLSNQMWGSYHNTFVPQVGTITMDQLMMDVTEVPDARVGDTITLLGSGGDSRTPNITLRDWAETLHTIEYELMCALRVRLPKTYVR